MSDNIYDYLKENFNIETDYKFKRDYIKNPLIKGTGSINRGEKPYKEDLEYLYITLNIKRKDLDNLFNMYSIKPWIKYFNLQKGSKLYHKNVLKTMVKKYGCGYPIQNITLKEKIKNTIKKRYGCEWAMENKDIQEKSKASNYKKLGVCYPGQSKKCLKKRDNTNIKKYGSICPLQNENVKSKANITMMKKYGCISPSQNKEISGIIVKKSYLTKKKNNTFNTSKPENEAYELLLKKYPDTIRQYKDERYQFNCDFYIPSLDLFIEYQGDPSHGGCAFIGSNEQMDKLNIWKKKSNNGKLKNRYSNFIKVWTIKDPLKRKTAKNNGLNWVEFFDKNKLFEYITNL